MRCDISRGEEMALNLSPGGGGVGNAGGIFSRCVFSRCIFSGVGKG